MVLVVLMAGGRCAAEAPPAPPAPEPGGSGETALASLDSAQRTNPFVPLAAELLSLVGEGAREGPPEVDGEASEPPARAEAPAAAPVEAERMALRLNGILYNETSPMAVINGSLVRVGVEIGGLRVTAIGPGYVVAVGPGGPVVMTPLAPSAGPAPAELAAEVQAAVATDAGEASGEAVGEAPGEATPAESGVAEASGGEGAERKEPK